LKVKNVTNHKILIAILIPILLIPLAGCTYAHMTDTVTKKYKLHPVCGMVDIESYKVYSPWNETMSDGLVDNTLFISAIVSPPWYVWVGFVIKNNGIYPINVTEVTYQVTGDSVVWNASEFYYGPYSRGDFNPAVWDDITGADYQDKLDPDDGVKNATSERVYPPVYLEPPPASRNKCKLIVWIYLEITDAPDDFEMQLSIIIPAIMVEPLVEGWGWTWENGEVTDSGTTG